MPDTQDSNFVGLRIAEEAADGSISAATVWRPLEPNSYGEFGAQVKTLARSPISASRQNKKGVVVDLDAAAGFESDFVQRSLYEPMQGFFFADWRKKAELTPTATTATAYTVPANGTQFVVNSLLAAEGFAIAGNNGLKLVTASAATSVTAAGLTVEAAGPDARIRKVGHQFAAGDVTMTIGAETALNCTAGDFTTLGVIPGEWLFIGGDTAATQFATAACNGFVRVKSVTAKKIVLDRTSGAPASDSGVGKTIQLFLGHVLKNESDPALIKVRTFQLERSLGAAGYEYVVGAVANTIQFAVDVAGKVTVELGFVGKDAETRTLGDGAKVGQRPALPTEEAFNSSSDFSRLRMQNDTAGTSLATYLTELKLSIDNGVKPNKAISVLGAISMSSGNFVAMGDVKAYFSTLEAVRAVRNNVDASLDFAIVKSNAGWLFDLPLVSLGDGRLEVEKDKPITIPLSAEGAEHPVLRHTLLAQCFFYLPTLAG